MLRTEYIGQTGVRFFLIIARQGEVREKKQWSKARSYLIIFEFPYLMYIHEFCCWNFTSYSNWVLRLDQQIHNNEITNYVKLRTFSSILNMNFFVKKFFFCIVYLRNELFNNYCLKTNGYCYSFMYVCRLYFHLNEVSLQILC